MADLPILPIDVADLIADTTDMSMEQFGAYMRILCAMWARGAELKATDAQLARIVGASTRKFRSIKSAVMAPIDSVGGCHKQKRLTITFEQVQRLRLQRVMAAKQRWNPLKPLKGAYAPAYANAYPAAHASAMQLKLKEDITSTSSGTAREVPAVEPGGKTAPKITPELAAIIEKKRWVRP